MDRYKIKHTIGPWYAMGHGANQFSINNGAAHIAEVEDENNAKLIAAAPELFECLESKLLHIEEWIDFMGNEPEDLEWLAKAKAALEKVRG